MRRAVVVLGSTVAGLAALFSYKTHAAGIAVASTAPAAPTVSAAPLMSPSALASPSPAKTTKKPVLNKPAPKPSVTKPATTPPTTSAPPSAATPPSTRPAAGPTTPAPVKSSAPAKPSGTFTGPSENTQYGPVQVRITVSNGKIIDANGSLPQGGDSIGQNALPQLNQEVLTAQSAHIQAVSGASYTSEGYVQSLQQAIDQAGL